MPLTEIELLELILLVNIAQALVNVFWLASIRGRQR